MLQSLVVFTATLQVGRQLVQHHGDHPAVAEIERNVVSFLVERRGGFSVAVALPDSCQDREPHGQQITMIDPPADFDGLLDDFVMSHHVAELPKHTRPVEHESGLQAEVTAGASHFDGFRETFFQPGELLLAHKSTTPGCSTLRLPSATRRYPWRS